MKKLIICFILIAGMLLCTSCQETYSNYGAAIGMGNSIPMGLEADKTVFEKDNVVLDLYFGTYDADKDTSENNYGFTEEKELFVICATSGSNAVFFPKADSMDNLLNALDKSGIHLIRTIDLQEASGKEYGYRKRRWGLPALSHCEQIIIPEELINGSNERCVNIYVLSLGILAGEYCVTDEGMLTVRYSAAEDGKIRLE